MNEELETTEQSFDAIPQEVQDYIYSEEFEKKLSDLFTQTMITGDKQTDLKGAIFGFIAQTEDQEGLNATINEATENEADRLKIREWVNINVAQKIFSLVATAYANEDEELEIAPATPTPSTFTAPAPASAPLSTLADSLKQVSTATATRRDYSDAPTGAPANLPITEALPLNNDAAPAPKTFDPYHEPIDK